MKILDFSLKKETENYKYFTVHYTPWCNSDSIKFRSGFVIKSTNDCHWSDTGKRLLAHTERAVLALVEFEEEMASIGAIKRPSKLNTEYDAVLGQIIYTKS